jgi:hypothetical protein
MEQPKVDPTLDLSPSGPPPWLHWRWLRDFAVVVFIMVCAWKLLRADLNINIGEFSFTDLLALILALFSVWLSAMFYFKADEASSRFYDNSYRFTKEMHVILGRMEVGFGEQLTSVRQGVTGLRTAIDAQIAKEVVVSEKEAEVQQFAEDLTSAPPGSPAEIEVVADLRRAQSELADARAQLDELRAAAEQESRSKDIRPRLIPNEQINEVALHILNREGFDITNKRLSMMDVRRLFKLHALEFRRPLLTSLRRGGLLDESGIGLNTLGSALILSTMRKLAGNSKA